MNNQPPLIEGYNERYHAGHNFDGAEPDRGRCFDLWAEAAGHLVSDMVEYADQDDDTAYEAKADSTLYLQEPEWACRADYPMMTNSVQGILHDDPPNEPEDFTTSIEDNDGRWVVFWLRRVFCEHRDATDI